MTGTRKYNFFFGKPKTVVSILITEGFRVGSDFRPYLFTYGLFGKIIGDADIMLGTAILFNEFLKLFHSMIKQNDNSKKTVDQTFGSENMGTTLKHIGLAMNSLYFVLDCSNHC